MRLVKIWKENCGSCDSLDKVLDTHGIKTDESINYAKDKTLADRLELLFLPALVMMDGDTVIDFHEGGEPRSVLNFLKKNSLI